jgi:hypothetical protein
VPVTCHNVPRNYNNEESCKLSYLPTACSPGQLPMKVIVISDANLPGIRAASVRDLYAVTGLALSDVYDESTGFNSPCAVTDIDQRSRWIKDETDLVCDNVADIGSGTLKIFQDFVDVRDISHDNDNIVDAVRKHRLCDAVDESKTYLGKVKASDGSCWNHAHISELDVFDLTGADGALYTITGNTTVTLNGSPSLAPTTVAPAGAPPPTLVNTILTPDSTVTDFGCNSGSKPWRIVDGTTVQYGTYDCLLVFHILSHSNYVHYLSHLVTSVTPLPPLSYI